MAQTAQSTAELEWRAEEYTFEHRTGGYAALVMDQTGTVMVALVYGRTPDEAIANARIMAAARRLLDAAEWLLKQADLSREYCDSCKEFDWHVLQNAVEKARTPEVHDGEDKRGDSQVAA